MFFGRLSSSGYINGGYSSNTIDCYVFLGCNLAPIIAFSCYKKLVVFTNIHIQKVFKNGKTGKFACSWYIAGNSNLATAFESQALLLTCGPSLATSSELEDFPMTDAESTNSTCQVDCKIYIHQQTCSLFINEAGHLIF